MTSVANDHRRVDWVGRLRRAAENGEPLDLRKVRPLGERKAIAATAVRSVLTDGQVRADPRGLTLKGACFDETLDLAYVHFPHPLHLVDCVLSGGLYAPGATIGGPLRLSGSTLERPEVWAPDGEGVPPAALNLDGATIAGSVIAADGFIAAGEVRAVNATIASQLDLQRATLINCVGDALCLDGAKIGDSVFMDQDFIAVGGVRAVDVSIAGSIIMSGARLMTSADLDPGGHEPTPSVLGLDRAQISGSIFADNGFDVNGEVRAYRATIGNKLDLTGAELANPTGDALALAGTKVGELTLLPAKWNGGLNLKSTQIGVLTTTSSPPGPLEATGWSVGHLRGPLNELSNDRRHRNDVREWLDTVRYGTKGGQTDRKWRQRTAWLLRNKPVSVQPWHELADVYERNGNPVAARRLRSAAANIVTAQAPWWARPQRILYWFTAGNGYYPLAAIISVVMVLGLGAWTVQTRQDSIVPTDVAAASKATRQHLGLKPTDELQTITARTPCDDHPDYPCMNVWAFTVNSLFPPAASTNQYWTIASNAPAKSVVVLSALKLALWALTALLLAGVAGLLKKT